MNKYTGTFGYVLGILALILLIVNLVIMESNFPLNPVNTDFVDGINDLDKRLQDIENTRQQYVGDWFEFNVIDFTYNADNIITVSNLDPLDRFQIGDKLWLVQGGTDKYFYIIDVDADNIYLDAGDDYTYTNTAITFVASSRLASPFGFPPDFNFTTSIDEVTWFSTVGSASIVNQDLRYRMDGARVSFYGDLRVSATQTVIYYYFDLPILNTENEAQVIIGKLLTSGTGTPTILGDNVGQIFLDNTTRWGTSRVDGSFISTGSNAFIFPNLAYSISN